MPLLFDFQESSAPPTQGGYQNTDPSSQAPTAYNPTGGYHQSDYNNVPEPNYVTSERFVDQPAL